ncbi:MAG: nucleotidyltransferase domain-containing protein [archaeon]
MKELGKNQLGILNLYRKNVFLKATIRELMKKLAGKSYQRVYESVMDLKEQGILKIEKIGNSNEVRLSLGEETVLYLSFLDEKEALLKKVANLDKILERKEFKEDIILVAGSYAKDKETKTSDIDLVIITRENEVEKQKLIDSITSLLKPEFHNIVFNHDDFTGMLKSKDENFGKEIFKNRIILRNARGYYYLLKEAIDNGFRG